MKQFVILLNFLMFVSTNGADRPKVLILGAGMAGISAGKTLTDMGEDDFLIIEGSDRIGGRVKHEKIGGYTVETGAGWITKGSDDQLVKMSDLFGIVYQESEYEDYVALDAAGNDITDEADARYEVFEPALEFTQDLSQKINEENLDNGWQRSHARASLRRGGWTPKTPIDHSIEYWDMEFEFAAPSELISNRYVGFPFYEEGYAEYIVLDQEGGFEKIVQKLSEEFLSVNDSRLIKNSVVSRIMYNGEYVTVQMDDGTQYSGDQVIITFSLGVLQKQGAVTFDPKLPDWKLDSIAQFPMNHYASVFVKFDRSVTPFWNSTEWTLIGSQQRGHYSLIQNFNTFYNESNILLFTLTDDEVIRINKMTDAEIKDEIQEYLQTLYGSNIPMITNIVVPRWASNPLFYGSYSDWPVGFTVESHDALKASVGRLHFAGEAYHREWFGYVTAAYYTGKEVAEKVVGCIADSSSCPQYKPKTNTWGCTYKDADNYAQNANYDDGKCKFDA